MKDKYIGFDIDSNKTVACVVEQGCKDQYTTLKTDVQHVLVQRELDNYYRRPSEYIAGLTLAL